MNVDLSPNMEDNRPLKISRVQSPEPETLPADTPEWAKIMYRSLNGRMTAFESNVNDTVDFVADTATSAFANTGVNKLAITEIREQFNHLQHKFEDMKIENKTLREKLVSQECYSRRDNLLFHGYVETNDESPNDCEQLVRGSLRKIGIENWKNVRISRCHRKGQKKQDINRPMIAKFHWFGDIKEIMSKKAILKDTNTSIFISQDWPKEVEDKRRILMPFMHRAREENMTARVNVDKLIVQGKVYTVDTLGSLPDRINPTKTATIEKDNCILFFSKYSPFSTHYQRTFKMNKTIYHNMEQSLQHQKALLFKDSDASRKIVQVSNPVQCRQVGRQVKNFNADKWFQDSPLILSEIAEAFYDQHSDLKKILLDTEEKKIVFCGVREKFWGTGLSMRDEAASDSSKWKGQNKLGDILMALRQKLSK